MPREIFGEVSNPSVKLGSQAWYSVPLSILVHATLIGLVVVVPLLAMDVLPSPPETYDIFVASPDLPEPPPPPAAPAPVRPTATAAPSSPDAAPIEPPDAITPEAELPSMPHVGVPGGDPGVPPSLLPSVLVDLPGPPAPPAPQKPAFFRPGGDIKTPTKIHHVAPVYPGIAREAKVEGMVIIEATIGTDGRVKDTRVLRSEPLLEQAAVAAVRQWRFTPTLLNGVPVPILMTVTVNFKLR
jgi:periplasmic protein TonB